MKVRKVTTYLVEDFELEYEPIEDTIRIKKTKNGFEVKYLVQDLNPNNPFEDDGNGQFYHWKDCGKEQYLKYCELLGFDSDTKEKIRSADDLAVRIDKYEHSGVSYSVEGEGTQCRWDTSHAWAVWYPDKVLLELIKKCRTKKAQRNKTVEYARQSCKLFNQWNNGDVYCIVLARFDKNKEAIDTERRGGHFGYYEALSGLED